MSKFLKQNLVKIPFHFVSQQKTRSFAVVFDVALAVRPIRRNNTFEIKWYIALLPNPVGSTAETSLPWHTILWRHSVGSSLRALWTKLSGEALKLTKTRSLRSPHQTSWWNSSARAISLIGSHTATQETNYGLSAKYLLFLDQSEKSPDSGLAIDKKSSNCIRRTFPPRKKIGTPDRRLRLP